MAETESQTSYFGTENLSVYDHPHSSVPKRMQGHFKKKTHGFIGYLIAWKKR